MNVDSVAVVCCYNNDEIMNSMLLEGLNKQVGVDIERLLYKGKFKSATSAFNHAIKEAKSDIFVFVHQDIKFLEDNFLKELVIEISKNPVALYGLCGTRIENGKPITYSNVIHGIQNVNIGVKNHELIEVLGLDEIFLACHRDVFKKILFDESTFNGWHIYIEDLCLQARINSIPIFVIDLPTQHKNIIEMPKYLEAYKLLPNDYFDYLRRLMIKYKKYRKKLLYIVCPCMTIKLDFFAFHIYYYLFFLKNTIRRKLRLLSM